MSYGTFEDRLQYYFQLKEERKEIKEKMDLLMEEIEKHFETSSIGQELIFELPDGTWAVIEKKGSVKDDFDKEGLAHEMLIAKDELKTPFDYCILTHQGKLTPDMISKHTHTVTEERLKMRKRKSKPRPKKKG